MAHYAVIALLLLTTSTTDADVALRHTPRKLQTYSQPSDYVGLMLERVNQERAAQGLSALCTNTKLHESAQRHSDDQATNNFMNHTGSDGSSMSERVTEAGYNWRGVAENVAAGQLNVTEVMDAWMNSEGHRLNILGDYTMLGAAYAYNGDGEYKHYWTQNFGRSDVEACDDDIPVTPSPSSNSTNSTQPTSTSPPAPMTTL